MLPKRADYVPPSNPTIPPYFMPNTWQETPYGEYIIYSVGVMASGRKAMVKITGVPIYVDVESDDVIALKTKLHGGGVSWLNITPVELLPGYKFSPEPTKWLRVLFDSIKQRKAALSVLSGQRTTSDDTRYLLYVLRAYNIPTADWLRFVQAGVEETDRMVVYTVDISGVKKVTKREKAAMGRLADKDYTMLCSWDIETHFDHPSGKVPSVDDVGWTIDVVCMSFFWHWSAEPLVEICLSCHDYVPLPDKPIGVHLRCASQRELAAKCIEVWRLMQPDLFVAFNGAGFDTPLLTSLIKQFGMLLDLESALTLWPYHTTDPAKVERFRFKRGARVKINAERTDELALLFSFDSVLDTDCMVVMGQAHPKAEVPRRAGLNYYLSINNLGGKEDMEYKLMARIFRWAKAAPVACHCAERCAVCSADFDADHIGCCHCLRPYLAEQMWLVMYYCKIDCLRPQQLYHKRQVLVDRREMANLARVPLECAFYQAGGMKVQNLLGKYAAKRRMAFSNCRVQKQDGEKDHNTGAYVPNPVLGLHITLPIFGVDASSLYPSLIMDGNYCPSMLVRDPAEAARLQAAGYNLRHIGPIHYTRGEKKGAASNVKCVAEGWFVSHSGLRPDSSHVVCGFDKDGAEVRPGGQLPPVSWPKRPRYTELYGRARLPGEQMGLLPHVCKLLFDKRVPIKAQWAHWTELAKEMVKAGETSREIDGAVYTLADVSFIAAKFNAKQNAIKTLNNTIYGQSGNFRSPTYEFMVAAAITASGQRVIKQVMEFTRELGGRVWYGDTDSEYTSVPTRDMRGHYVEFAAGMRALGYTGPPDDTADDWAYCDGWAHCKIDERSLSLRLRLWESMVVHSQDYAGRLCEQIGDLMIVNYGTRYLQFAFEEVGFPTMLCGKKKYAMIPHEKIINFRPPKVLVMAGNGVMTRGLDMVKQGVAPIAKRMGTDILYECLMPENSEDVRQICLRHLTQWFKTPLAPADVAKTARYKPDKRNVSVLTFVARMRDRLTYCPAEDRGLYTLPDPGDKFSYCVVERPTEYLANGNKAPTSVGHRMEFLHCAHRYTLDTRHYFEGSIRGLLSRYIAYHPDFDPPAHLSDDAADDWRISRASAWLDAHAKQYFPVHTVMSKEYRQAYRGARAVAATALSVALPPQLTTVIAAGSADLLAGIMAAMPVGDPTALAERLIAALGKREATWRYLASRGPSRYYRNATTGLITRCRLRCAELIARAKRTADLYNESVDDLAVRLRNDPAATLHLELSDEARAVLEELWRTARLIVGAEYALATTDAAAALLAPPVPTLDLTPTTDCDDF